MSHPRRWQRAQKHELQWWKHYLRNKDPANYRAWKSDYWRRILGLVPSEALPVVGGKVLDAGCGPAGIFMILDQQQVFAVDPLVKAYVANGLLDQTAFPWVAFHAGTLESVPDAITGVGPFRTIFCMNVLNHVSDIAPSSGSLHNLCAADASVILSIDVHRTGFFKQLFRILPVDRLHPHHLSLSNYEQVFAQSGFAVVQKTPIWKRGPMAHWLVVLKPAQK